MNKVQERNRLTCVLNVYHEQSEGDPHGSRVCFSESLAHSAQTYVRSFKVREDPSVLDLGWFAPGEVGAILIENLEGTRLHTIPSESESKEIELRVIEVLWHGHVCLTIPVRQFQLLLHPVCVEAMTFRCHSGSARARITIYPR